MRICPLAKITATRLQAGSASHFAEALQLQQRFRKLIADQGLNAHGVMH
jgi:hypothetical protein